jgi:hypothetical protein
MKNTFPVATRELEYIAFFTFQMNTMEGPAHVFIAVDAYSEFAFMLGVERDKSVVSVLKNIYILMEHDDFEQYLNSGLDFTLVLEEFDELAEKIEAILKPAKGKLLFNKSFNKLIAYPFLQSLNNSLNRY